MQRKIISLSIFFEGTEKTIQTFDHEYASLMELLRDKIYLDCFGECGGVGRCATCFVSILNLQDSLSRLDRNEQNTLDKLGITNDAIRLSCQIMITEALDNAIIKIEDPQHI